MASSLKHLSTAIIFIFSISLLPIHARDSVFFSKMQWNETSHEVPRETLANEKKEPMSFPPPSQPWGETPVNEKELMSSPPPSQQGYALNGHGTTELIIINNNNNNNNNNNGNDDADKCDNNSNGHEASSRYVHNEYVNKGYGMSDTRFINNNNNNNNNHHRHNNDDAEKYDNYSGHEASSRYVNNEHVNKGHGMSDTRFLENGKYHYDVQAEKYQNGYDPLSDPKSAGYVSYNGNGKRGGNYGYGGYRSGSSTNGNGYKEYSERVEQNQYNNERFGDQYSNEGQEDQFNTP